MAAHLYYCYRDFERARIQVEIAAQSIPNNPDVLELTALIDRVQGHWEKSTAGLERASTLDPRNMELLGYLCLNYEWSHRYRDWNRILDRLTELQPDGMWPVIKAETPFWEKGDVKGNRAAHEALPSSMKDDPDTTRIRVYCAKCERDFAAAEEIVSRSPNEEIYFIGALFTGALVPREITTLWLEFLQGNHPTMEKFGAAREKLYRKVEADPSNPFLLITLAFADASLGRREESIQEARRAMEIRPVSEDAVDGLTIAANVAMLYAMVNEFDSAFEQLNKLIKMPGMFLTYGNLKMNPGWDPLRKDPRFDKLLAQFPPQD